MLTMSTTAVTGGSPALPKKQRAEEQKDNNNNKDNTKRKLTLSLAKKVNEKKQHLDTHTAAMEEITTTPLEDSTPMSSVGKRRSRHAVVESVLSAAEVSDFREKLRIGNDVRLALATNVLGEQKTIVAQVVGLTENSFAVRYRTPDAEDDENVELIFPDDGDIVSATILQDIAGVPRFVMSTRPLLTAPNWFVYFDGSSVKGASANAPSAAAVVVKHVTSCKCFVMARFAPGSTHNVGEWSGCTAALRMAQRLPGTVAVVGDSDLVWKQLNGKSKVKAPHLLRYYNEAKELRDGIDWTRTSMHTMSGHGGSDVQLADHPAKLAVSLQRSLRFMCTDSNAELGLHTSVIGDAYLSDCAEIVVPGFSAPLPTSEQLFPELVEIPTRSKPKVRQTTAEMDRADAAALATTPKTLQVTSLEQYIHLRSFPARPEPPPEVREQWSALVLSAINRVTDAPTQDDKNKAMLDLMVLPNLWLPANVATSRIVSHFQRGEPFMINMDHHTRSLVEKTKTRRLAELVMRRAKNRDLRGAVQVLTSEVDVDVERSDDEKVAMLRNKFREKLAFDFTGVLKDDMHLPTFASGVLVSCVRKMKRTAASNIDAWQKGHLQFAMMHNPAIADSFCVLAVQILRQQFSDVVMNCLRAARLVAVPKPDGGVRPVAVSNFFLKVIGLMALRCANVSCSKYQYAIGKFEGTKEIVHKLRDYKASGCTISKFDSVNAYNALPRRLAEETIGRETCAYIKSYFKTVYYHTSPMVVYRKGGYEIIPAVDGVRQGDALSTYIFCKSQDVLIGEIISDCSVLGVPLVDILVYADDLNFVTASAADAARLAPIVRRIYAKYGMEINLSASKSAAFVPAADPFWSDPTTQAAFEDLNLCVLSHQHEFVTSGADISDLPTSKFLEKQQLKTKRFFSLLEAVDLHPAITFTILRICGNPRLEYPCSVSEASNIFFWSLLLVRRSLAQCARVWSLFSGEV